ncbi:GNAT family N-acetyltransferase [Planktothrix agardhii]|uniref:N-acetyltransferase n=2 Tax=Planktothrix agardhii TaxID=1160 RepID=A0A073CII4_PLAA1|nr:GNAT family N-acetyltransferase [Planktothrix agardhii]MCB8782643.1 GNAT family N-acetyltransferase [Planktothrix agardhii 1808]CAH2575332.1 putative glucosamine 6-phosphate N-acetyltransferase [Planktothrix rubescens]BBD56705.1 putative acetyltransferase [Planktothrix agardhii NIES-204]KEI67523.1 N-acetyltransferase [Planktothrix agardhii NIVA-CYA 126/8]MCB8750916.1 GNAT family N-acetyltransferase [Planktothrix agardhii 1810]
MSIRLEIKRVTSSDLDLLNQLYTEMDGELPMSLLEVEQIFEQIQQVPNYNIYIAWLNNEPVGTFSLLFIPMILHHSKSAVIDAVIVTCGYRNQGIGKAMMHEALKLSREAGCYKAMLSSNLKRTNAHQFYKSLGFKQQGWSFSLEL